MLLTPGVRFALGRVAELLPQPKVLVRSPPLRQSSCLLTKLQTLHFSVPFSFQPVAAISSPKPLNSMQSIWPLA